MSFSITFLLVFLRITLSLQDNASLYTVVTEGQLRSNSPFRLHITVYRAINQEPVRLTAILTSGPDHDIISSTNSSIDDPPNGQLLEINVPPLPSDDPQLLKVVGEGGASFVHEEWIPVQRAHNYYIEVTVDKDIYNVGDVVKFNALIVDNRMQAVPDGELANATVYNEYNVIIKEWINVPTKRGFIWGEVYLNDECHRGEHRIQVNYERVPGVRKFYVPDETNDQLFFDVQIEMPTDMQSVGNNTIVKGLISTNFKCGKEVYGTLDLEIKNDNLLQCFFLAKCKRIQVFKAVPIFGKKEFTFNLSELGKWVDLVTIKATVRDSLTGRVRSTVQRQSLNKFRNSKVKLGVNHHFFVPEIPFRFYIAHKNDSKFNRVLTKNGTNISLTISFLLDDRSNSSSHFLQQKHNYTLAADGRIYVNVTPPKFTDRMILQVNENNVILERLNLEKSPYNVRDHEMSIVIDDARVRVGNNVTADIYTSGNINLLAYDTIALRSKSIVHSGNLAISGKGPHRIEFPVTDEAVTYFHLIVYGVANDGLLVADQRLFNTQEIHPFRMSLKVEPSKPSPGSEVNITIESDPKTFIFLKAADSVVRNKLQLLTNEFLLSSWDKEWQNRVEASTLALKEIQFATTSALGFFFNRKQLFQYLSLRLHTNSGQDTLDPNSQDPIYRTPPATDVTDAFKKPRQDFSTLWMWRNYTIGEDGEVTFTSKLPDRISVWETQLYGVDDKHRISVLQGPKITVTKPLFAFIDLPPTLVRGEAVLIRVLIFQDTPTPVNVTVMSENRRFQILNELTHRVISTTNLTKEIQAREDGFGFATTFLLSPLYTGPVNIRVTVSNEELEDTVTQSILVQDNPSKLQPVIYDAKDANKFGEESCTQPSVKVPFEIKYRSNEKLNISFQVNSMNDEEGNLRVNACVKYVHKEEADVVLQIDLPSGFEFSPPLLDNTNSSHLSSEYELVNSNSRLRWYFKQIPDHFICLSVMAKRIFTVYNLQPAKVTAYTSFNLQSAKRARVYYRAPSFETI